jgi:hypothetical protein
MALRIPEQIRVEALVYRHAGPQLPAVSEKVAGERVSATEASIRRYFASDHRKLIRFLGLLRAGHLGLFLVRDREWISHAWCSQPGRHPSHLPRWICKPGVYIVFNCHTRPEFRGQGILKSLTAHLVSDVYTRHPAPTIVCDIHRNNLPSRRAFLSSGFAPAGVFRFWRLWVKGLGGVAFGGGWHADQPHPPLSVTGHQQEGGERHHISGPASNPGGAN